jgi:hypothetical protein
MINIIGVVVLVGGFGHVITGLVIFRPQLKAILNDGVVNAILPHFDRRAALWFILTGVMVAMTGHLLIHAAATGDLEAVRIAGWYLLGVSSVGTLTQTRSPSWVLVVLSLLLLGLSYFGSDSGFIPTGL